MKFEDICVILPEHTQESISVMQLEQAGFSKIKTAGQSLSDRELIQGAVEQKCAGILYIRRPELVDINNITELAQAFLSERDAVHLCVPQPCAYNLPERTFGFLSGLDIKHMRASAICMEDAFAQESLKLKGRDSAFYMNMLLLARTQAVAMHCHQTDQACDTQHFGWGLLTSSFMLYKVFIKFSIAAAIAYIVDIGTFYLFQILFASLIDEYKILVSTVLSRVLCSIATYLLNRGAVFHSQAKTKSAVVRFLILAVGQLVASWLLVWGIGALLGGGDLVHTALKIVVDLVIFLASFTLQRDWVFKESAGLLK